MTSIVKDDRGVFVPAEKGRFKPTKETQKPEEDDKKTRSSVVDDRKKAFQEDHKAKNQLSRVHHATTRQS